MADDISLRAVSGLPAIIVDKRSVASRVRRQAHIECVERVAGEQDAESEGPNLVAQRQVVVSRSERARRGRVL